jgi:hypothetical protein
MIVKLMNYIISKAPLRAITDQQLPIFSKLEALSNDEAVLRYRQALGGVFTLE